MMTLLQLPFSSGAYPTGVRAAAKISAGCVRAPREFYPLTLYQDLLTNYFSEDI